MTNQQTTTNGGCSSLCFWVFLRKLPSSSHRICQADLLTTFIEFIDEILSLYIYNLLGPLASYCFFLETIFSGWKPVTPPFHKISGWNANFGWNPELVVWQNYARKKKTNLNFLFSWAECRRWGCNMQKLNTGAWSVWNCASPKKRLKSCFQLQVLSPHVANGDVPGYRGRMWCSCGIGGEKLLAIKEGNIILDPSPDVFSTWWVSHQLYAKRRVSKTFCHLGELCDLMLEFRIMLFVCKQG